MKEPFAYLGIKGGIVAFDKQRGHIIWRCRLKGADYVVFLVEGDMIFAYTAGHLFGINRQSGSVLWENGLKGMGYGLGTLALASGPQHTNAMIRQILAKLQSDEASSNDASFSHD